MLKSLEAFLFTAVWVLVVLFLIIYLCLLVWWIVLVKLSGSKPTAKLVYNTAFRDFRAALRFFPMKFFLRRLCKQNVTVGKLFRKQVKKHPNKNCLLFEDQTWSFQEVEDYSNRVANAFHAAGYGKGDEVALFMENRPEFICIWLGLSKIGVVPALVNTNLRLHPLAHSINSITPKAVIFNADLATAVKNVVPYLNKQSGLDFMCLDPMKEDGSFHVQSLNLFLQNASKNLPNETDFPVGYKDKLFYIYTSGTTGFPKAAIIKHEKFINIGVGTKILMNIRNDEIFYDCLPLYHSSGGIVFISLMMTFGGTVLIRKKFSASNFWKDIIRNNVTVAQYIGEICRFLLSQPVSPEETEHTLRKMVGNGLRPQIWEEFKRRFRIPHIVEFYAATEGNATLVNMFGKVGAVGFIPRSTPIVHPAYLIKADLDTGEILRGKNGLCIPCEPGEPGILVANTRNNVNSYDGYVNESETNKKIIRNCLKKGDEAFNTGDVLVMDEDGYLFFVDRTGDTYRWRGENVSTTEVEAVISKVLGLATCVVYGVKVPGVEGRAGMAAIQSEADIDTTELYNSISLSLPTYAIPLFVRICKEIETTGTYKLKKLELQKETFNPILITDPIFMLDNNSHSYTRLDEAAYNRVMRGEVKL